MSAVVNSKMPTNLAVPSWRRDGADGPSRHPRCRFRRLPGTPHFLSPVTVSRDKIRVLEMAFEQRPVGLICKDWFF
jgi:hypothetical protein